MAKDKAKEKEYKTRDAKRRAEFMVMLTAKEKRVYTEKYKWTMAMQNFKVGRTWRKVLEQYAKFPLAHLDRELLSINRDQLDDMEGEQDDRAAKLLTHVADKANAN
ncbi:hypothetical protein BPOR_0107g00070 [Botrytis porri]|uniref:Uncharacterized protein n=1 Tax=Botrytis porri TaxID=87229 RepID=A0A4Z1KYA8_9HELO|nr:hypothetical protein BPOR_0107g00070 [Botrytis porri]